MNLKPYSAYEVYTLADSRTNEVRYVGCTGNAHKRLQVHVSEAKQNPPVGSVSNKRRWIASLLSAGLKPYLTVIETGIGDWASAERDRIAFFRELGCDLTNTTEGGVGGGGSTPESIAKMKAKREARRKNHTEQRLARAREQRVLRVRNCQRRPKTSCMWFVSECGSLN